MKKFVTLLVAFVFALSLALPLSVEARGGGGHSGGSRSSGGHSYKASTGTTSKSNRSAVAVRGYTKKNGTYVKPHMRSAPNGSKADNWSTKGNVNPYTGKVGTKSE
ncbi:hypothetical protein [Humidesulfovibrio idahonensis]